MAVELTPYLRFEIPMYIAELMQFIDSHKHLRNIEPSVLFLEHTRIIHERSEITARHVFHSEVDELYVLEGVE